MRRMWKEALSAAVLAIGLAASAAPAAAEQRMSIATGSTSGVYYLWGGALAKIWTESIPDVRFNVEATTGQVPNVKLLEAGDIEAAMVNVVTAYESWNKLNAYDDREYRNQRALFAMYPSSYVMVSLSESGIDDITDWTGKVVSFGTPGGTVDVIGRYILDSLGVKPAKIVNSGWGDVAGQMRDGLIDAIGAIGGQPWGPIKDIDTTHDVTFYDLTDAQIATLRKDYPYFVKGVVPAGTYDDMKSDYNGLAFWNMVLVSKDVSDDLAYQMAKTAFDQADALRTTHPSTARFFSPKEILEVASVPLHPGAIRYYEELGLTVPDSLKP